MKRLFLILIIIISVSGCTSKSTVSQSDKFSLSKEQIQNYKKQIKQLADEKLWIIDKNIKFRNITIPKGIEKTYYKKILRKSKDAGFDFTNYLGNQVIEGITNIRYNNGDTVGKGHFLFAHGEIVGAYYMVGNYIYSLNEREVFKKDIDWENTENLKKKREFETISIDKIQNLVCWGKYNKKKSCLFSLDKNKLKVLTISKDGFTINKEILLKDLSLINMFFKDIDKDQKSEIGVLLGKREESINKHLKSKLIIYDFEDKLKQKYSLNFKQPIKDVDFDGKDIVVTSSSSIEIYSINKNGLEKNYTYNEVGGLIKVADIDNSGIPRYMLRDNKGKDIYIFQKSKSGLEEIWRSHNTKLKFVGDIQTADLNGDGVKEIYLKNYLGNMVKVVLKENGFVEKNDIKKGHSYFVGDFNADGQDEFFDIVKSSGAMIYNY